MAVRTNRFGLRLSPHDLALLDTRRRPGETRSGCIRRLIHAAPPTKVKATEVTRDTDPEFTQPYPPKLTLAKKPDQHTHTWKRWSTYLDQCDCGAERRHQPGTR